MGSRAFGIILMLIGTATSTYTWGTRWMVPGLVLLLLGFVYVVVDIVARQWRDALAGPDPDPDLDVSDGWAERLTAQIRKAREQARPAATDQ